MIGKIGFVGLLSCGMAVGQTASVPPVSLQAKAHSFEVVSIRRNLNPQGALQYGATADGYRATGVPIFMLFMTAYTPQTGSAVFYAGDQLKGVPDWANERYDIDARIADDDRAAWQKPESQKVMLQAMLQAMFAD